MFLGGSVCACSGCWSWERGAGTGLRAGMGRRVGVRGGGVWGRRCGPLSLNGSATICERANGLASRLMNSLFSSSAVAS